MTNVATLYDSEKKKSLWGQARILTVDHEKRTAKIYLDSLSGIQEIQAVLALPFAVDLVRGDTVLVAGEDIHSIYIIGVLSVKSPAKIRARDGSYVVLANSADGSFFQVFSKDDDLLIEHDTENKKTKVCASAGDIEIAASGGNMTFQASETMTFKGETISLQGRRRLDATVQNHSGRPVSSLSLGEHQAKLSGTDLRLTAGRANLLIDELKITGKKILGNIVQATITADKLETRAQFIINKAKNIFQSVENLTQLKTGRLKTLIKSTYHLKSKNTVLKSEDDFKIKADKINLG